MVEITAANNEYRHWFRKKKNEQNLTKHSKKLQKKQNVQYKQFGNTRKKDNA